LGLPVVCSSSAKLMSSRALLIQVSAVSAFVPRSSSTACPPSCSAKARAESPKTMQPSSSACISNRSTFHVNRLRNRGKTHMLNVQNKTCTFGKIANNTETLGKDGDWRTGFTIPFKDLILERGEIAAFCDDEYLERILFDDKGNGSQVPTLAGYEPLVMSNDFENASVTIALPSRKSELEFDGCKVKDITLESVLGGTLKVSGKLYLHPGLKRENLTLQEYQHCTEVRLSIADAQIATKSRDKQQDLFQPEGDEKGEGFAAGAKSFADKGAEG